MLAGRTRPGPLGAPLGGIDRVANCHVVGLLPGIQPFVVGAVQVGLEAAGRAADLSDPGGHDPFMGAFPREFTVAHAAGISAPGPKFVYGVHSSPSPRHAISTPSRRKWMTSEYHAPGGRRWPIWVACSKAWAACRTAKSAWWGPTIWTPMGKPPALNAAGT